MASPAAVAAFMQITRAPESVAVQKLEEYGGNVNEAVNAYFLEGNTHISSSQGPNLPADPQYNRNPEILPLLNAARRFRPSLLLDANYRRELRDLYNGVSATAFTNHASPRPSHPPAVRELPAGFNSVFEPHYQSGLSTTRADTTGTGNLSSQGLGIRGTDGYQNEYPLAQSNNSHHVPDAEIEETMLQAAIEASKTETGGGSSWEQFDDSSDGGFPQSHFQQEDEDLARAMSLSLKDADYQLPPQADKQMELNSVNNGESHSSKKEDPCKKMLEEKETEEILDKKEVRLSKEPLLFDEVITVAVRMPDGSRIKQRFLTTDKLQLLFDFVDIVGFQEVKFGTYRLVQSYPRRAYDTINCSSTFKEVGLGNNETLFVEMI